MKYTASVALAALPDCASVSSKNLAVTTGTTSAWSHGRPSSPHLLLVGGSTQGDKSIVVVGNSILEAVHTSRRTDSMYEYINTINIQTVRYEIGALSNARFGASTH